MGGDFLKCPVCLPGPPEWQLLVMCDVESRIRTATFLFLVALALCLVRVG